MGHKSTVLESEFIKSNKKKWSALEQDIKLDKTDIFEDFNELSDEEIDYYLTNYKPYDKAGAYAIQEWIDLWKVKKIEGTFSNIMGLPMNEVYHELLKF